MLWKTAIFVIISLFVAVSVVAIEDDIEMSFDRMMADTDRCVENLDGLTTCTVKRGSTVGFSGSLLIFGSKVLDIKANLIWTKLGVTSFKAQQVCQINGRVYIGTEKCKRGKGDNVHRPGLHSAGPTPASAFSFTLPNSGSLDTDLANLTATVTWDHNGTNYILKDYLINSMIVKFSDN